MFSTLGLESFSLGREKYQLTHPGLMQKLKKYDSSRGDIFWTQWFGPLWSSARLYKPKVKVSLAQV